MMHIIDKGRGRSMKCWIGWVWVNFYEMSSCHEVVATIVDYLPIFACLNCKSRISYWIQI